MTDRIQELLDEIDTLLPVDFSLEINRYPAKENSSPQIDSMSRGDEYVKLFGENPRNHLLMWYVGTKSSWSSAPCKVYITRYKLTDALERLIEVLKTTKIDWDTKIYDREERPGQLAPTT